MTAMYLYQQCVNAKKNGTVIVTFLDDETTDTENEPVQKKYRLA